MHCVECRHGTRADRVRTGRPSPPSARTTHWPEGAAEGCGPSRERAVVAHLCTHGVPTVTPQRRCVRACALTPYPLSQAGRKICGRRRGGPVAVCGGCAAAAGATCSTTNAAAHDPVRACGGGPRSGRVGGRPSVLCPGTLCCPQRSHVGVSTYAARLGRKVSRLVALRRGCDVPSIFEEFWKGGRVNGSTRARRPGLASRRPSDTHRCVQLRRSLQGGCRCRAKVGVLRRVPGKTS